MKNSVKTFLVIALALFSTMFIGTILNYEETNCIDNIPHNYFIPTVGSCDTLVIDTIDVIEEDGIKWYTTDTLLLSAIMFVESRYNDSAYCASEDAVGCLQIRKTMVRDVNRILKRQGNPTKYKMKDRWDRIKSIEIFNIYCDYYDLVTEEAKARCWNGGPRGLTKKATQKYWDKVKDQIDNQSSS
jgi:hypothetical protein